MSIARREGDVESTRNLELCVRVIMYGYRYDCATLLQSVVTTGDPSGPSTTRKRIGGGWDGHP